MSIYHGVHQHFGVVHLNEKIGAPVLVWKSCSAALNVIFAEIDPFMQILNRQ